MTVEELRDELRFLPDDMSVGIAWGGVIVEADTITTHRTKAFRPYEINDERYSHEKFFNGEIVDSKEMAILKASS